MTSPGSVVACPIWATVAEQMPGNQQVVHIQFCGPEDKEEVFVAFKDGDYWTIFWPWAGKHPYCHRLVSVTDKWRPLSLPEGAIHCGNCGS